MTTEAAIKFWCLASLAAFAFQTVTGAGLTSDQLFKFAPLPAGSLPDEPLFTPDLRACVFASIHRSLSNLTLSDLQINARFLRLIFHDCASGGCNGSIMKEQEQKAFVNTFLSGYDQVRIVKSAADAACGTTLSYADTIVAGGFTGVYLSGGPNATQYVRFGRVDTAGLDDPSRVLQSTKGYKLGASEPEAIGSANLRPTKEMKQARVVDGGLLPSAFTINDVLISIFAGLGLNVEELVALSGAHTLGKATCANVTPRIAADPYADPSFLYGLTNQCRTLLQQLSMDLSPTLFDNSYYKVMTTGKGILLTDEGLYFENTTTAYAAHFALNQTEFFSEFTTGLLKMSLIGLRPPSITNLSAGIDHTMPINASIFLNGTASFYQFEIAGLQAALDAQFSTPNSQVVITSILPVLGNSSATNVTFSIVPVAINYNGTIPFQEAATILAALNATAANPSKLLLNNTLWGPVQGLQVLASTLANITTTFASPSNSTAVMRLGGAGNDQGAGPSTGSSASLSGLLSLHLESLSILILSTLLFTLAG